MFDYILESLILEEVTPSQGNEELKLKKIFHFIKEAIKKLIQKLFEFMKKIVDFLKTIFKKVLERTTKFIQSKIIQYTLSRTVEVRMFNLHKFVEETKQPSVDQSDEELERLASEYNNKESILQDRFSKIYNISTGQEAIKYCNDTIKLAEKILIEMDKKLTKMKTCVRDVEQTKKIGSTISAISLILSFSMFAISQITTPFHLGVLDFLGTGFFLGGISIDKTDDSYQFPDGEHKFPFENTADFLNHIRLFMSTYQKFYNYITINIKLAIKSCNEVITKVLGSAANKSESFIESTIDDFNNNVNGLYIKTIMEFV